jgi:hypothetical protein
MEAARDFGVNEGLTIPVHYNDVLGRRYTSVCALFWKDQLNTFFANLKHNGVQLHVLLLYLAQKIVDLHAADIKVRNTDLIISPSSSRTL